MNREEILKLSNEELRIKAAELDGWKEIRILNDGIPYGRPPQNWKHPKDPNPADTDNVWVLPDYPNDIAAAWGLEAKALRGGKAQGVQYLKALIEVLKAVGKTASDDVLNDEIANISSVDNLIVLTNLATVFVFAHCSSLNRTRAFVLAMTQEVGND